MQTKMSFVQISFLELHIKSDVLCRETESTLIYSKLGALDVPTAPPAVRSRGYGRLPQALHMLLQLGRQGNIYISLGGL